MRNIKVKKVYYETQALYEKANTKSQRALLGYMIKGGFARDPIYGGAFSLLRKIESYHGIYCLSTEENPDDTMEIIHIAESAMLGMWDDLAFSEREIANILHQLGKF